MEHEINNKSELKRRVRSATQYDDVDSLPEEELESIIQTTMLRVKLETGSDKWFDDEGLGLVLFAYTCMRAKAAVENIPLASYTLGAEQVSVKETDEETSLQLNQWADDVRVGLKASDVVERTRPKMSSTGDFIGSTSINSRSYPR